MELDSSRGGSRTWFVLLNACSRNITASRINFTILVTLSPANSALPKHMRSEKIKMVRMQASSYMAVTKPEENMAETLSPVCSKSCSLHSRPLYFRY